LRNSNPDRSRLRQALRIGGISRDRVSPGLGVSMYNREEGSSRLLITEMPLNIFNMSYKYEGLHNFERLCVSTHEKCRTNPKMGANARRIHPKPPATAATAPPGFIPKIHAQKAQLCTKTMKTAERTQKIGANTRRSEREGQNGSGSVCCGAGWHPARRLLIGAAGPWKWGRTPVLRGFSGTRFRADC
jgi:hypothetical protein